MHTFFVVALTIVQLFYLASVGVTLWFYSMPVNTFDRTNRGTHADRARPKIVLFYPVLRELEETMRTTMTGMARAEYPRELLRVIAIPNADDAQSIEALHAVAREFEFLEVMPVPATSDPSWNKVWSSWEINSNAYWWHTGKRAGVSDLPPKKTRQLIWGMYQVADGNEDSLLSYIDADSVVPVDYWENAAIASHDFDVLQNTNVNGNPLKSWPTSFYAMDHVSWDASMYKHMTADGRHPFWVLGKGLFFRFRDLLEAGGFHPWLTIEDPEVGMRLWTRGKRLGVIESPLIEEVPSTWSQGVTQRKRWVAGFFQSLATPLVSMGMPFRKRLRARLNFVPCLSLIFNPIGFAVGIWAIVLAVTSPTQVVPWWLVGIAGLTMLLALSIMAFHLTRAWQRLRPVLSRRERVVFLLRVNPIFLLGYWLWWCVPLVIGCSMWLRDRGLAWERTEKHDANNELIRNRITDQDERVNAASDVPETRPVVDSGPRK